MNKKTKKALYWSLDLIINLVIILGLVIVIQLWVVAPFDVSGKSMCDTLNIINNECVDNHGEKIIINEIGYLFNNPERGEIVVFKIPSENKRDEKYYIKRIIGVPGDQIKIENGFVHIKTLDSNEYIKIDEPYLNEENRGNTKAHSRINHYIVPEDHYFLLGDNRNFSTDSRTCFESSRQHDCELNISNAFVHKKYIRGKASLVWWPLSNIRLINYHEYKELAY